MKSRFFKLHEFDRREELILIKADDVVLVTKYDDGSRIGSSVKVQPQGAEHWYECFVAETPEEISKMLE